jgi:hypothetical protein
MVGGEYGNSETKSVGVNGKGASLLPLELFDMSAFGQIRKIPGLTFRSYGLTTGRECRDHLGDKQVASWW